MSIAQYTVKLSETAEAVYCDIFSKSDPTTPECASDLRLLDEVLDALPSTARNKKYQLAGKFSQIYRQKALAHCFTYRIDDDSQSILVIEISPLLNGDPTTTRALLDFIAKSPAHKAAREALGIPEESELAVLSRPTPQVN